MSAKTYEGGVSIIKNTKDEIALKRDVDGKFNAGNSAECYQTMVALSKKLKAPINKYCLLIVENGTEIVLLANRYGNPYIALLPKRGAGAKRNVTKLA